MAEEKESRKKNAGLFIPGGLLLGMGIGFAIDQLVAGMFIGLGVGFLLFGAVMIFMKE